MKGHGLCVHSLRATAATNALPAKCVPLANLKAKIFWRGMFAKCCWLRAKRGSWTEAGNLSLTLS